MTEKRKQEIEEMAQADARRIEEYPNVYTANWLVDIMDEDESDDDE